VRPEPPVIVEERVTGPTNPAEFTATEPEGRLPMERVSVAEPPEANDTLGPVGVPFEVVMLKSCGRTMKVSVFVRIWGPSVPVRLTRAE
jgi:hypothetical protein